MLIKAINPLKISDIVHALSALIIIPTAVTSEKTKENVFLDNLLLRNTNAVSPQ